MFATKVMGMVMSQLPPGMSMEMGPDGQPVMPLGPNGETPRVEVKVHMVQVPAHIGHALAMANMHNQQNGGGYGGVPMGMAMGPMGPFPFPLHMGPGAPPPATTPNDADKDKDKIARKKDKDGEGDADWEEEELDLDVEGEDEKDNHSKVTGTTHDKQGDKKKDEKDRAMPRLGFFKRMTQGSGSGSSSKDNNSKAGKDKTTGRVSPRTNGSGRRKGSGSVSRREAGMPKAAGKSDRDLDPDLEDDDNDNSRPDPHNDELRPGETSPGGKALLGLYEVLGVEAPRDQGLRSLWERMADEEVCERIAKTNRRALARELRRLGLWQSSTTSTSAVTTADTSNKQHRSTQSSQDSPLPKEVPSSADPDAPTNAVQAEAIVTPLPTSVPVTTSLPSDAKGKGKSGLGRVLRGLDDLLQRQVIWSLLVHDIYHCSQHTLSIMMLIVMMTTGLSLQF